MPNIFTTSLNSFEGELPEEKTILVTRKHWCVLVFHLWAFLVSFFLIFVIYFLINDFTWYKTISSLFWFLTTIYLLILWLILFYALTLYILTTLIVTNKRLIMIKQKGLFNYEKNVVELDKIQDISINIRGISAVFLGFGDFQVQTAGALVKFTFPYLPHPKKIKALIMSTKHQRECQKNSNI